MKMKHISAIQATNLLGKLHPTNEPLVYNDASWDVIENEGSVMTPLPSSQIDFRTIVENALVGLYIVQDDRISYVNSWLSERLGYEDPGQLIGKSLWDVIHSNDISGVKLELRMNTSGHDSKHFNVRLKKKDNSFIRVSVRESNTLYHGKNATIGQVTEFKAHKEIEKALLEYQEKAGTVVNEIGDSIAEVDLNGTVMYLNKAACKMLQTTLTEFIGVNYQSYVDNATAKRIYKAYNDVYKTGASGKRIAYEVKTRAGKQKIIEDSISLIRNVNEDIVGFRVLSREITDRVYTEKKLIEHRALLEAIFDGVKDGIITVDSQQRIIAVNSTVQSMCGFDCKNVIGKPLSQCLKQCKKSCSEILQQTLEKQTTIEVDQVVCHSQSCQKQVVSITSSPYLDPSGKFIGAVLVIRDITRLKHLERELKERHQFYNIIGKSKKMKEIYALLRELSNVDTTVLVTGESGTGKELIAKALHYSGDRRNKPFIIVNCSALTESLLESELFGHVKGAFTGAVKDKEGRFQAADGGTIVLDEIGDISPLIQLKLLRVLQEKEFERVGEHVPRKVDVRIIACTNRNLKEMVKRNRFREDLFYRLKVLEISLPSLRERSDDILLLTDHFRRVFNKKFTKNIKGVSNDVLAQFMDYAWPGNVRELKHTLERAFVLCHGHVITRKHLPPELIRNNINSSSRFVILNTEKRTSQTAQDIIEALKKTRWKKTAAARLLGISRQTLYRKIHKYDIMNKL